MALTERPYRYSFSLNEIRYCWTLADPDRAGLYLQVRIMYAAIGAVLEDFQELEAFNLKPNADGKIYFYLQDYLDSVLEYVLPDITTLLTNGNPQCCQFYVQFREVEDADTDNEYETTEEDHIRIAIKGGIEQHKHSRNNFFVNYLDTNKPWLTWQPANRFIFPDEPFCLSFLNKTGETEHDDSVVQVKTVYADGTYEYDTLSDYTANVLLVHVYPFAVIDRPDITATNKVVYYEFGVINSAGDATVINPYRIYVHYRPVYDFCDLIFFNSLGGVSSLRVVGDNEINYDRVVVESEKGIDLNAWQQKTKKHQRFQNSILLNRKYTGNIGLMNLQTQERRESMIDLMSSTHVYMLMGDLFVPIINLQENNSIGNRKNLQDGFPVQFALSESNGTFTPASKSFGQGTHTETYP